MAKKVSIKDIAMEAGVSATTVSIVLNGRAREMKISEAMTRKIEKLAEKMQYRPNHFAKGLRTGKTHTIGLIVDDISNYFFGHLAKVVEEEADKKGYTVMFCSSENKEGKSRNILSMLVDKHMDGYIIAPTTFMLPEIQKLIAEKRPTVLIDRYYPEISSSFVTVDNFAGALDAVNHLSAKGHKRIALVTNATEQLQMKERIDGYLSGLKKNKLPVREELILKIPFGRPEAKLVKDLVKFFTKHKGEIDAVFFTSNNLGIAGLEAFSVLGISVPEELSVICFDDNDLFRLGKPGITVMSQPIKQMARKALELLVKEIDSSEQSPSHVVLQTQLIERSSVKDL
ncbi:MAG TPA: LacI family DNA-binding transcriptional regulator [Flavihumibacter sp.]